MFLDMITADLTPKVVILRILLATFAGGLLGFEREVKRHPAGLRTYIIVCVGSCLVMLINLKMTKTFGSDVGRLPAQIISGMGFLGAGTIIVTSNNQIRGLTTAAGLWGGACLGIGIGLGFYFATLFTLFVFMFAMVVLNRVNATIMANSMRMFIFVEIDSISKFYQAMKKVRDANINIAHYDIDRTGDKKTVVATAVLTIVLEKKMKHKDVVELFSEQEGIYHAEEV